jgi:hypothetical protein
MRRLVAAVLCLTVAGCHSTYLIHPDDLDRADAMTDTRERQRAVLPALNESGQATFLKHRAITEVHPGDESGLLVATAKDPRPALRGAGYALIPVGVSLLLGGAGAFIVGLDEGDLGLLLIGDLMLVVGAVATAGGVALTIVGHVIRGPEGSRASYGFESTVDGGDARPTGLSLGLHGRF